MTMAPPKKAAAGKNDTVSVLWCGINRRHDEELGKPFSFRAIFVKNRHGGSDVVSRGACIEGTNFWTRETSRLHALFLNISRRTPRVFLVKMIAPGPNFKAGVNLRSAQAVVSRAYNYAYLVYENRSFLFARFF